MKTITITFESFLDFYFNTEEIAEQLYCENRCREFRLKLNFLNF